MSSTRQSSGHLETISDWHHVRHLAVSLATALLLDEDPVHAECAAIALTMAHLVPAAEAMGVIPPGWQERELLDELIPQLAEDRLLVVLLAIASVARGDVWHAASAAVDRLIKGGMAVPDWAWELRDPITVGECFAVTDEGGAVLELVCNLARSGRSSATRIMVDEHRCGAAFAISVGVENRLPIVLTARQRVDAHLGRVSAIRHVGPAEFRRIAEAALDARVVHDRLHSLDALHELAFEEKGADLEPGYQLLATLLRSRLRGFPTATPRAATHTGPGCPGVETN